MQTIVKNAGSGIRIARAPGGGFRERSQEIASLYIEVFGDSPWFEKLLILQAGSWLRVGSPDEMNWVAQLELEGLLRKDEIKPFYTMEGVTANLSDASASSGFVGLLATDETDRVVGVSWGMGALGIPDPEKRRGMELAIESLGLNGKDVSYSDETFVKADCRGIGIGSALVRMRGLQAARDGFGFVLTRTINPVLVQCYVGNFGAQKVREVYADPEDQQPDRRYYLIDLRSLRRG